MKQLSEKGFPDKAQPSKMVGGTVTMATANFLVMVLGLTMSIVATRKFSAETYGSFILFYLLATFLSQFSSLGVDVSVSRSLATCDDPERKVLLVNNALTLRLITFGLISLLTFFCGPLLFKVFKLSFQNTYYTYVIILYICECFTNTFNAILQGFFSFKQIAIWNFSSSLLNLVLIFVLSMERFNGLEVLLFARGIAYLLAGIYLFLCIPVRKRLVIQPALIKEMVRFGFPLQLNDILSYFYSRIDSLMIAAFLGPADLAYYEIAHKIPDGLSNFFDAFRVAYFPSFSRLFARQEKVGAESLLKNALRLTTFCGLFASAFAFLFGKQIFLLLFSTKYLAGVPAFIIIMISLSLTFIGSILGNSLVAVGESDKPAKINLVHASLSLCGNFFLIPPLGILGAAITRGIGPIATNPLNYYFLKRKFDIHVLSAYLKPIFIFIGWISLLFFVPLESLLVRIAALLIFVLLNIAFSVINKDDYLFLQSQVMKIPLFILAARGHKS
jgi:O-antigen/teichoic acid export membrane protein